jgi:hypothetical protein
MLQGLVKVLLDCTARDHSTRDVTTQPHHMPSLHVQPGLSSLHSCNQPTQPPNPKHTSWHQSNMLHQWHLSNMLHRVCTAAGRPILQWLAGAQQEPRCCLYPPLMPISPHIPPTKLGKATAKYSLTGAGQVAPQATEHVHRPY